MKYILLVMFLFFKGYGQLPQGNFCSKNSLEYTLHFNFIPSDVQSYLIFNEIDKSYIVKSLKLKGNIKSLKQTGTYIEDNKKFEKFKYYLDIPFRESNILDKINISLTIVENNIEALDFFEVNGDLIYSQKNEIKDGQINRSITYTKTLSGIMDLSTKETRTLKEFFYKDGLLNSNTINQIDFEKRYSGNIDTTVTLTTNSYTYNKFKKLLEVNTVSKYSIKGLSNSNEIIRSKPIKYTYVNNLLSRYESGSETLNVTYNKFSNLEKINSPKFTSPIIYKYDVNGNLLSQTWGTMSIKYIRVEGKLEKIEECDSSLDYKIIHRYNDFGDKISEKRICQPGSVFEEYEISYIYKYDSRNNWTIRKDFKNGNQKAELTREIEYYE